MRLSVSKSANATSFYVIKSLTINGKRTSKVVEKLGTLKELEKKLNGRDPYEWAKEHVKKLNLEEAANKIEVVAKFSSSKKIIKNKQFHYNGGYLFLQRIYNDLKLPEVCKEISNSSKFKFNLNSILSRLIYSRIIFPSSKLATAELSKRFIEQPNFKIHQIYRALETLCKSSDFIQSSVYKNSLKLAKRNDKILFYDCTNYFFEIEQSEGLRQYGISKENRPNPVVQMGLFMDGDGFPLAFSITEGNTNEQTTLQPLEKKILRDFQLSQFIVCTDAGLSSENNRRFNSIGNRAFITTQSIKKLRSFLKKWALDTKGWRLTGSQKLYDVSKFDGEEKEKYRNRVFYKERWINENGFEQKIIVTYSIKYKEYQCKIRETQLERAIKVISQNPSKLRKANSSDYKRFIKKISCTDTGEIALKEAFVLNQEAVDKEAVYDGFYAVCTNLELHPDLIIKINKRRWQIEECFRIMKHEFKARPVYLSRNDRIEAHFLTCYLALLIFRILEKLLNSKYTCKEIIDGLRDMNFYEVKGEGFIPTYTRNDFTDDLHDAFGFRTDFQIMTNRQLKKIIKI